MFSSPEKNSKKLGIEEETTTEKVGEARSQTQSTGFENKVDEQQKSVGNLDEHQSDNNQAEKNNDLRRNLGREEKKDDGKSEAFDWDEGQKRLK